jgi:hypothetical protein
MKIIEPSATEGLTPLDGELPEYFSTRHQDNRHVVLKLRSSIGQRAAVWDRLTGLIEWHPSGAVAISWNNEGSLAVVLTPEALEVYSWPGRELLDRAPFEEDVWGEIELAVSPDGKLVAVNCGDGVEEFLSVHQLRGRDETPLELHSAHVPSPRFVLGHVFSPTGSHLVGSITGELVWWAGGYDGNWIEPSPGGEFEAGQLHIWSQKAGTDRSVPLKSVLEKGWRPASEDDAFRYVSAPEFLGKGVFRVLLPTAQWRAFDLNGNEIGTPQEAKGVDIAAFHRWTPRD